jgi:hypothetical protein
MIHNFREIDNPDGDSFSPVHPDFRSDVQQENGALSVYNPESEDLRMARQQADEIINTVGATVKVYIRTDNADFDPVFDEDPDPTYWNCVPMKAFFRPQPLELELAKWGINVENKTEIVFSHRQLYEQFGDRMLRHGDVIQLPYNATPTNSAPKNYRIVNGAPSGNFRYHWLYYTCHTEILNADVTVRPPDETPSPEAGGGYYESL